jgi:hypothetical protein
MAGYDLTRSAAFLGESWLSDSTFLVRRRGGCGSEGRADRAPIIL